MKLGELGEFGLISRIAQKVGVRSPDVVVGIGDDAAVLKGNSEKYILISTDAFVEDVHFRTSYCSFFEIGWRIAAANISDIAAMGGRPKQLFVTIALPGGITLQQVEQLYEGLNQLAEQFQVTVAGGDTVASPGGLFISVTITGEVNPTRLKLRSGARPGEGIFVTGCLGLSKLGLDVLNAQDLAREKFPVAVAKHLTPTPRVREVNFLVERIPVSAMIDISDGLASEIYHICTPSGVGARLQPELLPVHPELNLAVQITRTDVSEYLLRGGEDFEILFTAPLEATQDLVGAFKRTFDLDLSCVGETTESSGGIVLVTGGSRTLPLPGQGFDHFR